MFQILRRLKNLKTLSRKHNDSSTISIVRACSSSTGEIERASLENNRVAQANNSIKGELTLREQVKRKRAEQNTTREDLDNVPREELMSMIRRLNETNKQLVTIIHKGTGDTSVKERRRRKWSDTSGDYKRHILLRICYLGWNFGGYVVQNNLANTIEQHIFSALSKSGLIESRQTSNYNVCGRTDKGVSAFEQVISIDVKSRVKPGDQLSRVGVEAEIGYCKVLNSALPKEIRAISWRPLMSNEYSARFDCEGRTYKYFFHRGDLHVDIMQEACHFLVGTHDFRNFCKSDVKNGIVNHVRRLDSVEIKLTAQNHEHHAEFDVFCLEIKGLSFLWHMIRFIVSVLMMVGKRHESPEIVRKLLDVEVHDRKPNYHLANQVPLNLFMCNFREEAPDANDEIVDTEMLNRWVFDEKTTKRLIIDLQSKWCDENIKSTMLYEMLKLLREEYRNRYPDSPQIPVHQENNWKSYSTILDRQKGPSIENRIQHFTKMLTKV